MPEGVLAPFVTVINDTAVRVSWQPPLKPNGPIIAYYLSVNDVNIDLHTAWPSSYVIAGLQPYTVYDIQVLTLLRIYLYVRRH